MLPDKIYNILKVVAQYVLPATAALYFGLAGIWGLPYSEQVVGTILAIDAFLGTVLGVSVVQYTKKLARTNSFIQPVMPGMEPAKAKGIFGMSDAVYDICYWIVQVLFPSVATLYFALAAVWALPYANQIVGTIALIDTFFGVFLGISTSQYKKSIPEIPA